MSECECSECGASELGHVWGFALLAQQGWHVVRDARRPAARSWLCAECGARAERFSRSNVRASCTYRVRRQHVSLKLRVAAAIAMEEADLPSPAYR